MINFPTSLDSLPNPTSTDLLENATTALDHDVQHSNANDAIEALEAKVGANSSAVTSSHDYKLSGVATGDKAVSKTGAETLINKTLTAPQVNMGGDATGDMYYRNALGVTTRLPAGSDGQIIYYAGGIPVTGANPAAADASTTQKGVSEEATQAEVDAGTAAGASARLFQNPSTIRAKLLNTGVADTGTSTAYAIAPSPAITAYATYQEFTFKALATNTTTTPTINVNSVGVKTIVRPDGSALAVGDIVTGRIYKVVYDGTNMQLFSSSSSSPIHYLNIKSPQESLSTAGANMSFGCDMSQLNPTYLWFAYGDTGTSVKVFRLDKQTSGNYIYKGVTATITTTTSNLVYGVSETGGFVYVWFTDNGTSKLTRFTTALASPTTITSFSTSTNASNSMSSDVSVAGKLWVKETDTTTVKSYTISGTAASVASTVTLSVGTTNLTSIYKSATDIFIMDDVDADTAPNVIRRYDSTGNNGTDITTALFSFISGIERGLQFVNVGGSVAYVSAQKLDGSNAWYFQIQPLDLV